MGRLRTELSVFKLSDFDGFNFLDDEEGVACGLAEQLMVLNTADADRAFCGTLRRDGRILFIGGFFEGAPGVAEVFAIPDREGVRLYPKTFHRLALCFLNSVLKKDWCDRIETASVDNARISAWMLALRFSCEGYTGEDDKYKKWGRWA